MMSSIRKNNQASEEQGAGKEIRIKNVPPNGGR